MADRWMLRDVFLFAVRLERAPIVSARPGHFRAVCTHHESEDPARARRFAHQRGFAPVAFAGPGASLQRGRAARLRRTRRRSSSSLRLRPGDRRLVPHDRAL